MNYLNISFRNPISKCAYVTVQNRACQQRSYLLVHRKFPMMLYVTQYNSDWLFITPSIVLQTYWLISENIEKTMLHINLPYQQGYGQEVHNTCAFIKPGWIFLQNSHIPKYLLFYTRRRGTTKHQTRSDDVVPQARAHNKSITPYLWCKHMQVAQCIILRK